MTWQQFAANFAKKNGLKFKDALAPAAKEWKKMKGGNSEEGQEASTTSHPMVLRPQPEPLPESDEGTPAMNGGKMKKMKKRKTAKKMKKRKTMKKKKMKKRKTMKKKKMKKRK